MRAYKSRFLGVAYALRTFREHSQLPVTMIASLRRGKAFELDGLAWGQK